MSAAKQPQVWVWWSPGEYEDDLHGFVTREHRDAHGRGETGPFKRVVRDNHKFGPVSEDTLALRHYFKGTLQQYLENKLRKQ